MKSKLKTYKVKYEYRGFVTVEVEANNESNAEMLGMAEADQYIAGNLSVYDVVVSEVKN